MNQSDWEGLLKNRIKEVLKPDHVAVDIGACVGDISEALVGNCGEVFLFEPDKNNYNTLKEKFKDRCTIENCAVGNTDRSIHFYTSLGYGKYGGNIMGTDVSFKKSDYVYDIGCTSIDSYFRTKKVDLIKIDVEGAEKEVLKGGLSVLCRDMPYLFLELHHDEDYLEIKSLLSDIGYQLYDMTTMTECTDKRPYQMFCKAEEL